MDLVLPPRCFVSGEIVDGQGMVSARVWRDINFIVDPMCVSCGYPFSFDVGAGTQCAICLDRPQAFDRARAALRYDDISRDMILKFKHADKTHAVPTFLPWLKRTGGSMLAEADYIVPVPLHRWRLLKRRYNQAALLAQALARDVGKPYKPDIIERVKATPSQGHLGYKERRKNVRGAFKFSPQYRQIIKDKNIVLVDDVYTTGATVSECAKVLKKAGAARVYVLALARVVREDAGF